MKSFFLSIALLLCGATVFASANPVPQSEEELVPVAVTLEIVDDEICYSTTLALTGGLGGVTAGASVTISGCGDTAEEAWSNYMAGMREFFNMQ